MNWTHVALVGLLHPAAAKAGSVAQVGRATRDTDPTCRVRREERLSAAQFFLGRLEVCLAKSSATTSVHIRVLDQWETHLAQKKRYCKMLGSVVPNGSIGLTHPCSSPSSKVPKTQRCQSVKTQYRHLRRLHAPHVRDQYHEALERVS